MEVVSDSLEQKKFSRRTFLGSSQNRGVDKRTKLRK
jgi:hypothetical protein